MQDKTLNFSSLFDHLNKHLDGELFYDDLRRAIYATDASEYREYPLAVAYPKNEADLKKIIDFVTQYDLSMIPRAAGTSLAGQCVGNGIVVDISKYWTHILEINIEKKYVVVQPGVIRDELNEALKKYGYFFSPITSTANRAMLGGMVGNNSSGTTSIKYGVTRDKVLELKAMLSDGSEAIFKNYNSNQVKKILEKSSLESKIYQHLIDYLSKEEHRNEILEHFPKKNIHRRNTGYAVDELIFDGYFTNENLSLNLSKLLCGSEGTLAFTTAIKLKIDALPPQHSNIIAIHCGSIKESLIAAKMVMTKSPFACELMDKTILDCTKTNIEQQKNRWFVKGDPAALLLVELRANDEDDLSNQNKDLIQNLELAGIGYHFAIIPAHQSNSVWKLRSAGLGLLANLSNDKRAVACIEDTAVAIEDLPSYIEEFDEIMSKYGQKSVYYAHAGAGELHLRPILDLRQQKDVALFQTITWEVARLVKKYRGSLSGEHGDGRVRANFIPFMVGDNNYQFFKDIKSTWDPNHIFNPGKIVDSKPMTMDLRSEIETKRPHPETFIDFSKTNGIFGMVSKCNGSGDCRKLPFSGGTMCPSYQASLDEKDTTRARANTIREFLTKSHKDSIFNHKEINEVLDLCISCKGCKSECPSNVDMALIKAEIKHQANQSKPLNIRDWFFTHVDLTNRIQQNTPLLLRKFLKSKPIDSLLKSTLYIANQRQIPKVSNHSLRQWYKQNYRPKAQRKFKKEVVLFCDEFTNRLDTHIGIKAIQLLDKLNYNVLLPNHSESGRSAISKGNLPLARKYAQHNIDVLYKYAMKDISIIGIEPSTILSFRDEYPLITEKSYSKKAEFLSQKCQLIEEFLCNEVDQGNIDSQLFDQQPRHLIFHGHCHQKALSDQNFTSKILTLPTHHTLEIINSGCCGMAGSFGYEKEHYEMSMKIGEMVLFPAVRKANSTAIIVANGTSCRHQILDGTSKSAKHPIEILYDALIK